MDEVVRVGLVAADPLRVLGLQAIVEARGADETRPPERASVLVPLTLPQVLGETGLTMLMIDAGCTEHLFDLLGTLRRNRPGMRIVVIGESEDQLYIQRVIGAGAKGYFTHTAGESEIRMALRIVEDGSVWAPRKVLARLLDHAAEKDAKDHDAKEQKAAVRFTAREVEVLRLLVGGMGNREIAFELKIDESTVKAHLSRLMRKVGAKNRIELTIRALKHDFMRQTGITKQ